MIDAVVIATKNPDKIPEIEAVLAEVMSDVRIIVGADFPDVEETGATLEENALLKARSAVEATGHPAIADDTGLEVDALGGRPGVHTARFAGPDAGYAANRARLLEEMDGVAHRAARFRTVVVLAVPGGSEVVAEGTVEGSITTEERGSGGFGYDPIFEVEGATLAEHGMGFKNRVSHRARALRALAEALGGAELP